MVSGVERNTVVKSIANLTQWESGGVAGMKEDSRLSKATGDRQSRTCEGERRRDGEKEWK